MKQKGILSTRKAEAVSNGLFYLARHDDLRRRSLALALTDPLGMARLKTTLNCEILRLWNSTLLFVGLFLVSYFNLNWSILTPILFVIGGLYIILREYYFGANPEGEDVSDEIKDDVEL